MSKKTLRLIFENALSPPSQPACRADKRLSVLAFRRRALFAGAPARRRLAVLPPDRVGGAVGRRACERTGPAGYLEAARGMVRKPAGLDPERLVFIDETWATTNMARKKGRARKGARPKVRGCAPLPRAPKTSASLRRRYAARALCSWTQSASSRRFRLKKTGVRNDHSNDGKSRDVPLFREAQQAYHRESIALEPKAARAGDIDVSRSATPPTWPEPRPLPKRLLPVAHFDASFLPSNIRPWGSDVADRMQCPAEYVAIPAVVALGAIWGAR